MTDIKSVLGAVIVICGSLALLAMFIINSFNIKMPKFLHNNRFEIALLLAVSCIMGLILIIL